ncbi:MAG: VanZ family protein [Planctomycetia bacterium]|nr:VanZ family protein [Planctomycetia bacterium]
MINHITSAFTPRRLLHLLSAASLCYWLVLTVAMHVPLKKVSPRLQETIPSDKTIHFVLYAGLALLAIATIEQRAWVDPARRPVTRLARYGAAFLFCTVNGLLDEVTQPLTNRACDLNDFIADCIGAALALVGFYLLSRIVAFFWDRRTRVA